MFVPFFYCSVLVLQIEVNDMSKKINTFIALLAGYLMKKIRTGFLYSQSI
jgi:hypothetical protein